MRVEFLAQEDNGSLWMCSNSCPTGINRLRDTLPTVPRRRYIFV